MLTRDALARYELPHRSRVNMRELWRELFHSESSFTATVEALEVAGWLQKRPDGKYRVWDAYEILDRIAIHARVTIPGTPSGLALATLPRLFLLSKLDEMWWDSVEAARIGLDALWDAHYVQPLIQDPTTGRYRPETFEEATRRYDAVRPVIEQEVKTLADRLPAEEAYWKEKLGTQAWLVIELRNGHLDSLARLCAEQLTAAGDLAQLRLGKTRREIRALVGGTNNDLTAPALSAASFSVSRKAFDAAVDEMVKALGDYNGAMPAALQLAPDQPEQFAQFLAESGLQEWYTELSIVTWGRLILGDMSEDQRIGLVYGRVRTLCALLEEALLSLAEYTGHGAFRTAVEKQATLHPRLLRFVKGPGRRPSLVRLSRVEQLAKANKVEPGMGGRTMAAKFVALGMPSGKDLTKLAPSPEQVLAGLIVIRNLTSHRFPIVHARGRVSWFEAWGDHLPAINRTVLWAALMLWAIAKDHKTHP